MAAARGLRGGERPGCDQREPQVTAKFDLSLSLRERGRRASCGG